MPTTFRPYQPDQLLMLPESLQDWLPEGHLSQHVSDLVDGWIWGCSTSATKAMAGASRRMSLG